jgi:hypothetical protein
MFLYLFIPASGQDPGRLAILEGILDESDKGHSYPQPRSIPKDEAR